MPHLENICQVPGGKLQKVEFTKTGKKMLQCASKLEDKSLHVRLNSVCDPSDAVPNDVQYHLKCWIYLQRKTNKDDNSFKCSRNKQCCTGDMRH